MRRISAQIFRQVAGASAIELRIETTPEIVEAMRSIGGIRHRISSPMRKKMRAVLDEHDADINEAFELFSRQHVRVLKLADVLDAEC